MDEDECRGGHVARPQQEPPAEDKERPVDCLWLMRHVISSLDQRRTDAHITECTLDAGGIAQSERSGRDAPVTLCEAKADIHGGVGLTRPEPGTRAQLHRPAYAIRPNRTIS
jgi:hypothetical protein